MAVCKHCGGDILWMRLRETERKPPYYAKPLSKWTACCPDAVPYVEDPTGEEQIVTREGELIRCMIVEPGDADGVGYIPHRDVCEERRGAP